MIAFIYSCISLIFFFDPLGLLFYFILGDLLSVLVG